MAENTAVTGHFQKTQGNPGGAAEDEGVDESCICGKFPEEEKGKQDGDSGNGNDPFMSAPQYSGNAAGFLKFIHPGSAPSRLD